MWRAGREASSGKHLHPVRRSAPRGRSRAPLHPEIDLDDVVGRAAGGFDAQPDVLEDVDDLRAEVGRDVARAGLGAVHDARHHDVADAAGIEIGFWWL